jgi:glutathione S-transferase
VILVGQYDSPFVRRVAVTMNFYRLPFERQALSVFRDFDAVLAINPLGKVPVLRLDNGEWLFDSRAILDHLDSQVAADRRLAPADGADRRHILRIEAVALGLTEKLYERIFEAARRSADKRDPSVVARVPLPWLHGERPSRADVTTAIALTYMKEKQPNLLARRERPALEAHCDRCEDLPEFRSAAYSAVEAESSGWRSEAS